MTAPAHPLVLAPGGRQVMGVVNVTPDSFSDGGRYLDPDAAIAHGLALVAAGAAVLDVGGESTRPGAAPVDAAEELRRVLPVVAALAAEAGVPVGVDTTKPTVAEAALAAGAALVNDVSGGDDPALVRLVAAAGCGYAVMHHVGLPAGSRPVPAYVDVVRDVAADLARRAEAALAAGVRADGLLVDPGLGFGKDATGSVALLARLDEVVAHVGQPVLVGASRKSFLGAVLGRAARDLGDGDGIDVGAREEATLATVVWAFQRGAAMVRVHEARAAARVVQLLDVLDRATQDGMRPPGAAVARPGGRVA
jgi:dihydropteroate synthase